MGEVKREGVRRFEMSVHPEPEVPYSVRPIPDEHGAFTYWGTWMDDPAKEITTLRAENDRLLDEAYNARQSAKGENALRLEAERERDEARAAFRSRRSRWAMAMPQ